jgi:hypothetical protein
VFLETISSCRICGVDSNGTDSEGVVDSSICALDSDGIYIEELFTGCACVRPPSGGFDRMFTRYSHHVRKHMALRAITVRERLPNKLKAAQQPQAGYLDKIYPTF